MSDVFSLLATTYRGNERNACSELQYLLGQTGDTMPHVYRSDISGLILAKTVLDAFESVRCLRAILLERPYEFRYLLRVIPIEKVVRTDLAEIGSATAELVSRIEKGESYRVTVEKRFTSLSSHVIIETVARDIDRRVDLEKPDKILLVEIVGRSTGLSLVTPNDILSVIKEKLL